MKVTGRAGDSARVEGVEPAPLDKEGGKRHEEMAKDEKDIPPKDRKARLAAKANVTKGGEL